MENNRIITKKIYEPSDCFYENLHFSSGTIFWRTLKAYLFGGLTLTIGSCIIIFMTLLSNCISGGILTDIDFCKTEYSLSPIESAINKNGISIIIVIMGIIVEKSYKSFLEQRIFPSKTKKEGGLI